MPEKPCTNTELTARIVALETDLAALRQITELTARVVALETGLNERDERYKQRAASQDNAVQTALLASEKAVSKAEAATERRLEGLNELRQLTNDQALSFARKDEVKLLIQSLEVKIQALDEQMKITIAHGGGIKDAWGYMVGAAGVAIALATAWFHR